MHRPETGLGAEAAQGEQEGTLARPAAAIPILFMAAKSNEPAARQQGEESDKQNHAHVGGDEIDRARAPDFVAVVLKVTRKNDERDMASHASRNKTPSRASTTPSIDASSRLKKTTAGATRPLSQVAAQIPRAVHRSQARHNADARAKKLTADRSPRATRQAAAKSEPARLAWPAAQATSEAAPPSSEAATALTLPTPGRRGPYAPDRGE